MSAYSKAQLPGWVGALERTGRCAACNGGPEHHEGQACKFHWVYRGRDGKPFRLVRLSTGGR